MTAFTIPTIYTAEDRFSVTLKKMGRSNASFANSVGATSALSERAFRKVTPAISEAGKQLLSYASAAAVAGAAIGIGRFSIDSIMQYEDALASFRTIVSELSNESFSQFETSINEVAKATKKSSIEVAQSFEKIAGLNSTFAESAEGISAVSRAAITLSKASRDDLGKSAENLVGIMNQFSFGAEQADRTIQALAAGQAVGAASISQTAEAFTTFGAVAAGANISLEQSVALVEVLGQKSIFGSEAGTQLKGSIVQLQKAGLGYKSGLFNINDALIEAKTATDKLRTAKEKDAYITDTFGLINLSVGRTLLGNIDTFNKFTKEVSNTTEATKASEINSNTLSNKLNELKASWINMLTGSAAAGEGLNKVKNIVSFVASNLDTIVSTGLSVIKFFLIWKAVNLSLRAVMLVSNIALGIQVALQKASMFALRGNAVATNTYTIASRLATASQWLWNAAMSANPIVLVTLGVAALTVGTYALVKALQTETREQQLNNEIKTRALESSIDQRVEASLLFTALKNSAQGSSDYTNALKKLDELQPGIVEKYSLQTKSLNTLSLAYKDVTANIMQMARQQAIADIMKEKTRALIESQNSGVTIGQTIQGYLLKVSPEIIKAQNEANLTKDIESLASQQYNNQNTQMLNPNQAKANANVNAMNLTSKTEGEVKVVFENSPKGMAVSSNNKSVIPYMGSTYAGQ